MGAGAARARAAGRVAGALALGLVPFLAGCFSQPVGTLAADRPVRYTDPPLPVYIAIARAVDATGDAPAELPALVTRSLRNVLRASNVFVEVRELAEPATRTAGAPSLPEVLLEPEIVEFELYQSWLWWLLYIPILAIPVIGTGAIVAVILLAGGPILSDVAMLALRVRAIERRSGRVIGTYRGTFDRTERRSIYRSGEHAKSFIYHPEEVLQGACDAVVHEIIADRWTFKRLR